MYLININKKSEISATANHWLKKTYQGNEQVEIYKPILLPKGDGQQNREILDPEDEDQLQPPIIEEIPAQLKQEDVLLDLEPILDNVDSWVRR